jgi:hypothetical protein
MPLLTPGLNEATAKTLTKRLHKSLKAQQGTPTLTQLQTLMAQAMGHQDWHAARTFWESPPALESTVADEYAEPVKDHLQACLELLKLARQGQGQDQYYRDFRGCAEQVQWILHYRYKGDSYHAQKLLEAALELDSSEHESVDQFCERLERLVIRAQINLWKGIGEGESMPVLPTASNGIIDEYVGDPSPLSEEEEAEQERQIAEWQLRDYQQWAEEERDERNKQRPLADQILVDLQRCVTITKSGTGAFLEPLQASLTAMEELRIGIYYYPDRALRAARSLTNDSLNPAERSELLERLEYCQRRIQAKILKNFFPDRPREWFIPAWEELLNGATLIGHWELMEQALELSGQVGRTFRHRSYEEADAVRLLCNWWNAHAPEGQREARAFFVAVMSDDMVSYIGYNECPEMFPSDFLKNASYALFPSPKGFCYLIQFVQGSQTHTTSKWGITTHQANGQEMWTVGTNDALDESHYAIDGLHRLKKDYETRIRD